MRENSRKCIFVAYISIYVQRVRGCIRRYTLYLYEYTRRHLPRFARLYLYLQHHDARAFRGFKAFLYFRIRLQLKCIIYDMLRVYYMCVRVEWKKVLIVWSNYQICAYHSSWGIVRIVAFCIGLIYCGRKGFLSI